METFLRNFFKFSYHTLAFPYTLKWEPGLQISLQLRKTSVHYYLWLFGCLIKLAYSKSCWLLFFYFLPKYIANSEYVYAAFHIQWATVSSMLLVHQLPHLKFTQEIIQLSSGLVGLIRNLESQHFGQDSFSKSKRFRINLISFLIIYCFIGFLPAITIIFLCFHHGYWQIGSFVYHGISHILGASSWERKFVAVFLGILVDEWNVFYVWGTFYLSLHLNLAFMHTFKTAVIKMIEMEKFRSKSALKLLHEQSFIYSKLRIIATTYNAVYGMIYVPGVKTIFGIMLVQSIFVSVRLSGLGGKNGALVTMFGIACCVVITIILPMFVGFMAMVNGYSKKFLIYLKRNGKYHGELGRRMVRSFRVEAVISGGMYSIEKITCLTVLALVCNMSGSVLISIKL